MSLLDTRLDRLMPTLTAKERALLVLGSLKGGTPEDPKWRRAMPTSQVAEFNRYIGLMNACNVQVGALIMLVNQSVEKLELRFAWFTSLVLWGRHAEDLEDYIDRYTREPVTESEYHELQTKARAALVPVADLAAVLVEQHEGWTEEELEDREKLIVKANVWQRLQGEKAKELARLVAQGVLQGAGKGKALRIHQVSFYAWLGRDVPVEPEWGSGYEVLPDGESARVEFLRKKRQDLWQSFRFSPAGASDPVRSQGEEPPLWSRLAEALQERMKAELPCHWQQLRAVEMVLDEVAEEFGGEDVLKPTLRQEIAAAKEKALAVQVTLQEWTGAFELPEPDPEALKETRRLIKRAAET